MLFSTLSISATGLAAQRTRMDIHAQNLANVDTTRTAEGGPYRRRAVIFEERTAGASGNTFADVLRNRIMAGSGGGGVRVHSILEDPSDGPRVYDPGHPDADAYGYVMRPNVNVIAEMVNMISASRSYEANMTAWSVTQSMMNRTLEISGR